MGRLPGDCDDPWRRGRSTQPERQVVRRALPDRRPGARAVASDTRLRARRRGGGRRGRRPRDVLRDAAGKGGDDVSLRRVRPARGGRGTPGGPPADRAARTSREARRSATRGRSAFRQLRRRPGALRGRAAAALRGDHGEASRFALRAGKALTPLAEDQDAGPPGTRRRGLYEGAGTSFRRVRRAGPRRQRERRPSLGGQCRYGLRRQRRSHACSAA